MSNNTSVNANKWTTIKKAGKPQQAHQPEANLADGTTKKKPKKKKKLHFDPATVLPDSSSSGPPIPSESDHVLEEDQGATGPPNQCSEFMGDVMAGLRNWSAVDIDDLGVLESQIEPVIPQPVAGHHSSMGPLRQFTELDWADLQDHEQAGEDQNLYDPGSECINQASQKIRGFRQYKDYSIQLDKFQSLGSITHSTPPSVTPEKGVYTINSALLTLVRANRHSESDVVKQALERWRTDLWNSLVDPCEGLGAVDFMYCIPMELSNSSAITCLSAARTNLIMAKLRLELRSPHVDDDKICALADQLPNGSQQLANETESTSHLSAAVTNMREALTVMREYNDCVLSSTMSRLSLLEQKTESRLAALDCSLGKMVAAFEKLADMNLKDLSTAVAGAVSMSAPPTRTPSSAAGSCYAPSYTSKGTCPPPKLTPINLPPAMD